MPDLVNAGGHLLDTGVVPEKVGYLDDELVVRLFRVNHSLVASA